MTMKTFYAKTKNDWRKWLERNHLTQKKVCLIKYKKHTGKPTLTNKEAMEEAICFGWIDTTIKRLDEERYQQTFVKRNKNCKWSNNTLSYAKKLQMEGRMKPYGLKMYQEGLKKPVIDHNLPTNPNIPDDLKKTFKENKIAGKNFSNFAPSYKRFISTGSKAQKKQRQERKD